MGKFLKNFGLGLVYILVLPIFLAALAIAAVYGFFACIVLFCHATYRFFKGEDPFKKLDDDKKVDTIKIAQMNNEMHLQPAAPAQSIPASPSNVYVQQNYYQNNRANHQKEANSEAAKPVEANGFYKDAPALGGASRKNQAIDVTPKETPSLTSNHSAPSIPNRQQTLGFIDIPKDDDGKDK
jgi:hypothetical protein